MNCNVKWTGAIAVAAALTFPFPSVAAECKQLTYVASLDMKPLPSGRPSVQARIGDAPATMLIDTGGYVSSLTSQAVEALKLGRVRTARRIKAIDGATNNIMARVPSILIGGQLVTKDALYYVLPGNNGGNAEKGEFDGILAGEFLSQFDADFDFAARKLNLFSPDHCAGKVIYWQPTALAIVPMSIDSSNHIRLQMLLDGQKVEAILDTGATQTTLNLSDAEQMFKIDINAPDVERVGGLNGDVSAVTYRHRFQTLGFGAVTIRNPELLLFREAKGFSPLILGMSILSRFHVYVAFNEHRLYITPAGGAPAAATGATRPGP